MSQILRAPEDGLTPVAYTARRLVDDGFVRNKSDLYRMVRRGEFPAPYKRNPDAIQAGVIWHGPSVRAWWRERLAEMEKAAR